jgi:hypothetical protein
MRESRRSFLRRFPARALGISTIVGSLASTGCDRANAIVDPTNIKNAQLEPSLISSIAEGAALGIFNNVTMRLARKLGLPIGNAYAVKTMDKKMSASEEAAAVAGAVTVGPAIEEWLFRLYPSRMWVGQDQSTRWDVGAVSSLAYALFHNLNVTRFFTHREPPILTDRLVYYCGETLENMKG